MHSGWDKHGAKRRSERESEKDSLTLEGTKQQVQATPLVILVSTLTRLGQKAENCINQGENNCLTQRINSEITIFHRIVTQPGRKTFTLAL